MSSPASRNAFRFASLEQPQHPDAAAGDAVAVSPFVFEEFAGGLLDERGVVVCHSKGGAQTNQKGITVVLGVRSPSTIAKPTGFQQRLSFLK